MGFDSLCATDAEAGPRGELLFMQPSAAFVCGQVENVEGF